MPKTVEDLGKAVKAKYPEYADMSDRELGQKIKAKYPEYRDYEDVKTGEATIGGTGLDVSRGLAKGLVKLPFEAAKIPLAGNSIFWDRIVGHFAGPDWHPMRSSMDFLDNVDKMIEKKIDQFGAPLTGYHTSINTPIGSFDLSGQSVGEFASMGALPATALSEATKGLSWANRIWKGVKGGAAFGAAGTIPDVVVSKDMKEFQERALNAGVGIGMSALMGGAFTGGVEALRKIYDIGKFRAMKRESLEGAPPRQWEVYDEKTDHLMQERESLKAQAANDPKLDVSERVKEIDTLLAQRKQERFDTVGMQKERIAKEAEELKVAREKMRKEDADLQEKVELYQQKRAIQEQNNKDLEIQRELEKARRGLAVDERQEMEDFARRKALADKLRAHRENAKDLAHLNAEIEGIVEVVEARGHPVGDLWDPSSKLTKDYAKEVREEIGRRIQAKREALEGADYDAVNRVGEHQPMEDIAANLVKRTKEARRAPHDKSDPRLGPIADDLLAKEAAFTQKVTEGSRIFWYQVADGYRQLVNPMANLSPAQRKAFDVMGQMERIENIFLPQIQRELKLAHPELTDRQLFTLFRDPVGKGKLSNLVLSDRGQILLGQYANASDQIFNTAVREGVLKPSQFIEDFVSRVVDPRDLTKFHEWASKNKIFEKNPHSMTRVFQSLWDAANAGIRFKTLDIAQLFPDYMRSMTRTIVHNNVIRQLEAARPEAFRYVGLDEKAPHGFKPGPERLVGHLSVDEAGVPKMRYIEENAARVIENMMSHSVPQGKIDRWNSKFKKVTLSIDVYHLWQLLRGYAAMTGNLPFGQWRKGYDMLATDHAKWPLIKEGIDGGLSVGLGDVAKMGYDREIEYLTKKAPWTSRLFKDLAGKTSEMTIEKFSDYLWNRVSPGIKALTYVKNLETLLADKRMQGMERDQLVRAAAKMTNEIFGGTQWRNAGRSAAFERYSRLMVLAPNWLETRFRLFGGGLQAGAEKLGMKAHTPEGALYEKYWRGYVSQAMLTAGLMNAAIYTAFPSVKKYKEAQPGLNWLTHITFPVEDRNGRPLVMSPMPALAYIFEAAEDPARFWDNRESAALNAFMHLRTGRDYKGARDRPKFWSLETFLNTVGDVVPIPMLAGGTERAMTSETPEFEWTKFIARSLILGLHNAPTYPIDLLNEEEFLKNEAAELNKRTRVATNPIYKAILGLKVRRHNAKVDDWIRAASKREGAEKMLANLPRYLKSMEAIEP